jgi:hypothetical protein
MPTTKTSAKEKIACLNPHSGREMNIDKDIYDLFSKAIKNALKNKKTLTFTELTQAIKANFTKSKIKFDRSLDWYAVTIKNDMDARGQIKVYMEKGKKLHALV